MNICILLNRYYKRACLMSDMPKKADYFKMPCDKNLGQKKD